jgi:hypothetical protein
MLPAFRRPGLPAPKPSGGHASRGPPSGAQASGAPASGAQMLAAPSVGDKLTLCPGKHRPTKLRRRSAWRFAQPPIAIHQQRATQRSPRVPGPTRGSGPLPRDIANLRFSTRPGLPAI